LFGGTRQPLDRKEVTPMSCEKWGPKHRGVKTKKKNGNVNRGGAEWQGEVGIRGGGMMFQKPVFLSKKFHRKKTPQWKIAERTQSEKEKGKGEKSLEKRGETVSVPCVGKRGRLRGEENWGKAAKGREVLWGRKLRGQKKRGGRRLSIHVKSKNTFPP